MDGKNNPVLPDLKGGSEITFDTGFRFAYRDFKLKSKLLTECVSAPTEI